MELKRRFKEYLDKAKEEVGSVTIEALQEEVSEDTVAQEDVLDIYIQSAFKSVRANRIVMEKLRNNQAHWMLLKMAIFDVLPADLQDKQQLAQDLVSRFMNEEFGEAK